LGHINLPVTFGTKGNFQYYSSTIKKKIEKGGTRLAARKGKNITTSMFASSN
jgi:hypothetical protein